MSTAEAVSERAAEVTQKPPLESATVALVSSATAAVTVTGVAAGSRSRIHDSNSCAMSSLAGNHFNIEISKIDHKHILCGCQHKRVGIPCRLLGHNTVTARGNQRHPVALPQLDHG